VALGSVVAAPLFRAAESEAAARPLRGRTPESGAVTETA